MLEAFLSSSIGMATPILLAALGELLVEESGIINIGIEGAMLCGAFFALTVAYFPARPSSGLGPEWPQAWRLMRSSPCW